MTQGTRPLMQASEESTRRQLGVARRQGDALQEAVEAMNDEAQSGVHVERVDEYEVAVAIEEAEGMWVRHDDRLEWEEPADENCHVEVCVRDRADGRFIPALDVRATLVGPDGTEIGTHEQSFLWHPWLHHYGRNWTVPEAGDYRVRVRIEPPAFPRHDHENGRRFLEPVEVEFGGVHVEPARKGAT